MDSFKPSELVHFPHHIQQELCTTRAVYRQGRKLTAVKVYTVNKESQHLLIFNVPAVNIDEELRSLCERFGDVITCTRVKVNELTEEFTNVFHVQYAAVYKARFAKKELDNRSFFGGLLHVCYAPELESVEETRKKLITRRKEISYRLKSGFSNKGFRLHYLKRGKLEENEMAHPSKKICTENYAESCSSIPQMAVSRAPQIPTISSQNPVDITPFKKLLPRPVSRIVFHNKT